MHCDVKRISKFRRVCTEFNTVTHYTMPQIKTACMYTGTWMYGILKRCEKSKYLGQVLFIAYLVTEVLLHDQAAGVTAARYVALVKNHQRDVLQ